MNKRVFLSLLVPGLFCLVQFCSGQVNLVQLRKQADAGTPEAAYELAHLAKKGMLPPLNEVNMGEYSKYIAIAATKDYPPAMLESAALMLEGKYMSKNLNAAFALLSKLIKMPVDKVFTKSMLFEAYYLLGQCYEYGYSVRPDITAAYRAYLVSSIGNMDARIALSRIFLQGNVGSKDPEMAAKLLYSAITPENESAILSFLAQRSIMGFFIDYLEELAKLGSPRANYELANIYIAGKGVSINRKRALELYEDAAKKSYAPAILTLAGIYDGSIRYPGLQKDPQKALEYYLKYMEIAPSKETAAIVAGIYTAKKDRKNAFHYLILAENYKEARALIDSDPSMRLKGEDIYLKAKEFNAKSKTPDLETYMEVLRMASNAEYPPAQKEYYEKTKNYDRLFPIIEKEADNGNIESLYLLSNAYLYGQGVKKDVNKGLDYLRKTAKLNNDKANYLLARAYHDGQMNLSRDWKQYMQHLKAAAFAPPSRSNQKARLELYQLMLDNRTEPEDDAEIVKTLLQTPRNPNASYFLGKLYATGTHGVKKNLPLAIHYFSLAVNGIYEKAALQELYSIYKFGDKNLKPDSEMQDRYQLLLKM